MTFAENIAKTTPEAVVKLLREAADHMDRVGFHQGGLFASDVPATLVPVQAEVPCCGWGACEVVGSGITSIYVRYAAEEALSMMVAPKGQPFLGHYPTWNDKEGRTKEEALEMIRATADALEQRAHPFTHVAVAA